MLTAPAALAACGTTEQPTKTYSARWQGDLYQLKLISATVQSYASAPDAQIQGQAVNFHTTDPKYSCFEGQALNVFQEDSEYHGKLVISSACSTTAANPTAGTWTFVPKAPPAFQTTATYNGHTVTLIPYPSKQLPSDAVAQSSVSAFHSTDPNSQYACFEGSNLKVYVPGPAEAANPDFTGRFLVYDVCFDGKTKGSWIFTPIYSYSASIAGGKSVQLQPYADTIHRTGNVPFGHVYNFTTDDPAYSCLNGKFPERDHLPTAASPIPLDVVYGTCINSLPAAWIFQPPPVPTPQTYYFGVWKGKQTTLTPLTALPSGQAIHPISDQIIGFQTNDTSPQYTCLLGTPLNVAVPLSPVDPSLAGKDVAEGSCLSTNALFTFPASP